MRASSKAILEIAMADKVYKLVANEFLECSASTSVNNFFLKKIII